MTRQNKSCAGTGVLQYPSRLPARYADVEKPHLFRLRLGFALEVRSAIKRRKA
jgi:hypothetical protein